VEASSSYSTSSSSASFVASWYYWNNKQWSEHFKKDAWYDTCLLIFSAVIENLMVSMEHTNRIMTYIRSWMLLSASVNSIISMPSPVYLVAHNVNQYQCLGAHWNYFSPMQECTSFEHSWVLEFKADIRPILSTDRSNSTYRNKSAFKQFLNSGRVGKGSSGLKRKHRLISVGWG
jgi:hypothetical protein